MNLAQSPRKQKRRGKGPRKRRPRTVSAAPGNDLRPDPEIMQRILRMMNTSIDLNEVDRALMDTLWDDDDDEDYNSEFDGASFSGSGNGLCYGFSHSDMMELAAQGVKPWDDDAHAVLAALNGDW